jgi:hypothetical protein
MPMIVRAVAVTLAVVGLLLIALGLRPSDRGTTEEVLYLAGAGLVHLVSAAGVYVGRSWGRALGILLAMAGLLVVLGIGLFAVLLARAVSAEVPGALLAGLLPLAVYGFVAYVLIRRWPVPAASA